jgi:hypothetical protein
MRHLSRLWPMPARSLRRRLFMTVLRPNARPQGEHSMETGQTKTDIEPETGLYRHSDGPLQS